MLAERLSVPIKVPVRWALGAWLAVGTVVAACGDGAEPTATSAPDETPTQHAAITFSLGSDAFAVDAPIPARYTCDGGDVSPALAWSDAPAGTEAFALIMDDPDAPGGVFTHWVLYNLPPDASSLPEGVAKTAQPDVGGSQGLNDFGDAGYGGPCPPSGPAHRYDFALFALDETLDLDPGASKQQVLDAMQGHVLGEARLTGTYQR